MTNHRINVRLDARIGERLREEVRATGKNESEVVREALTTYFAKQGRAESALDLARRLGVVGCAKGLPRDLSMNKEHLEDFGR